MLLIVIVALSIALVVQHWQAARREAELQAQLALQETQLAHREAELQAQLKLQTKQYMIERSANRKAESQIRALKAFVGFRPPG
jgi:hypothetical protein